MLLRNLSPLWNRFASVSGIVLISSDCLAVDPLPGNSNDTSALIAYLVLAIGLSFILAGFILVLRRHKKTQQQADPKESGAKSLQPACFIRSHAKDGGLIKLNGTNMTIGRDSINEIPIKDQSVSRQHARVELREDNKYSITDLDSLNGLYVNDKQVHSAILKEGDVLEVGDIKLQFTYHPDKIL